MVVLRTPALICDQRVTGRNWVRELDLADCDRCEEKPSFLKIARQKKPSPQGEAILVAVLSNLSYCPSLRLLPASNHAPVAR